MREVKTKDKCIRMHIAEAHLLPGPLLVDVDPGEVDEGAVVLRVRVLVPQG